MAGLLKRRSTPLRVAPAPVSRDDLAAALGDADLAARIHIQISTRARRLCLKVDAAAGHIVLVRPPRAPARATVAFVASRRAWIARHLRAMPARMPFAHGAHIPVAGTVHTLCFRDDLRGGVWAEDGHIFVSGRAEHGPRRVRDWLKAQAKTHIAPLARDMAARIDRVVAHVGVRDTTSRWGSCSRRGRLSFSWRLILAPPDVLTYVVAHEVAHLKHMNHSAAFWRTVDEVLEGTGVTATSGRQWLRRHGIALHRYG